MVTVTDGSLTEADARAMLERIRWPEGVRCVFEDCDGTQVYRIDTKGNDGENGKRKVAPRHLFKCKTCRRQFTVTKGTIFEDSHIPLRTWISVMYSMCSSKRGVSAYQIKREYGLSYEAAWFMCHRIRWAMTEKSVTTPLTGTVEADTNRLRFVRRVRPSVQRLLESFFDCHPGKRDAGAFMLIRQGWAPYGSILKAPASRWRC